MAIKVPDDAAGAGFRTTHASSIPHELQQAGSTAAALSPSETSEHRSWPTLRPIEFPALTGLRGVLAIWVVLYHVTCGLEHRGINVAALVPESALNLLHSGSFAVDMFFVLSGLIMMHVHAADFTPARTAISFAAASLHFWSLRFIRLWPVHALILAAYGLMNAAGFSWAILTCGNPTTHAAPCERFSLSDLPSQLLMVTGWGSGEGYGWNFVTWSISAEWLAYAGFPVAVLLASRLPLAIALVVAAGLLAASAPYQLWLGPTFHDLSDSYSAFRVVPGFLAGCLLARLVPLPATSTSRDAAALAVLAASALAMAMLAMRVAPMWAIMPGAIVLAALASKVPAGLGRALAEKPMMILGRCSYSLYVSHFLVLEVIGRLTENKRLVANSAPRLVLSMIVTLVICIAVGWALHRVIEDPARRKLRARLGLG